MIEHIFRAYDVRGVFNKELTADTATKIGMAFGTYLKGKGRVIIGRDIRTSSEILENAFIAGLASTGVDVVSTGLVPIPVLNFTARMGEYDAGAYITASHNPPEYNGVRLRRPDGSGYTNENQEVWKTFLKGQFTLEEWDKLGKISRIDNKNSIKEYKDYLLQRIKIKRGVKAVLDIGNGAAFETAPQVLNTAGVSVVAINDTPDGTFPARPPEPNDKTLGGLKKKVVEEGADFGVGYDGDGDRAIFVDDKGRTVQTEKIGIILCRDILKRKKGTVIANVSCSMIVEEEIEKLGGEVKRVRVGDVFVCEAIKEHNAVFAMETSAHLFMPEYYIFDDPILATLLLSKTLAASEKNLSTMADEINSYPYEEINLNCKDDLKFRVMEEIIKSFKKKGHSLDLIDGAKIKFPDGWVLLRTSNTSPLIRAAAEAKSKERLNEFLGIVRGEFEAAVERV